MKEWGYAFPPEWGDSSVSWFDYHLFHALGTTRDVYWRMVRQNPLFIIIYSSVLFKFDTTVHVTLNGAKQWHSLVTYLL